MQTGVFSAPRTERVQSTEWEVKRAVSQQILRGNEVVSNPVDFFNVASKLAKKIKILWLPLDETSKVVAKLDERFAYCAVVCGTQTVHYLKREDDTCIATALNSPFTRDVRLTAHQLMPVEKVAAGVATSPPLQTPAQCRHNCWKLCAGSIRDDSVQHKNAPRAVL